MNKKVILTEQQHALIINQILKETVDKLDEMEANGSLDEGFWDTIKYGLSKLGRYKAGGKIFGKSEVDQEYADKIKKIIDKEGNELIRQLDAKIKEANPEFPNSKDPQQFLTTVMEIAAVYDSIVAATQKQPEEEGYMPVDAANGIINDLREYTNKFLDVDLASVYSGFDESEKMLEEEELDEEQFSKIDEDFGLTEADPLDAGDVRTGLQSKRGEQGGEDFSSTRMDTLKSNKLPLVLAGIGASLGALGWMAQTDWFKTLLESLLGSDKIMTNTNTIIKDVTGGPADKQGFVHWAGEIMGKDIKTGADLQQFINKYGAENVSHMFDGNGGGDSMGQMQKLQQLINGNPSASMGDLFNKADQTFGNMSGGQNLFGVSKAATFFATTVTKQITKTLVKGAGTVVAAKIAGLGAILTGVGIGLITTGALVKLIRIKGQKSSRAATLNALYQSMRNIEGGVGIVEPTGDENVAPDGGKTGGNTDGGGRQGGVSPEAKTNLYNNLKSLFQFIVNNKNTMGTKTQYNTGTGGASAQAPLAEGKYINDKRVIQYLTKSLPFDKVKNFEDLLNRVEIIRNTIKKMGGATGDKTIDGFLKQLDSNPIMLTNFAQLTTVDPNNAQEVNQLLLFIKETLLSVYSGNYKFGGMVDKMSTLGGGNINKVTEEDIDEAAGYSAAQPNKSFMKDANSRTTFKNNLVKFLGIAMNMFQYLHKTQGGQIARKDTTNKYVAPPSRKQGQPTQQAPAASPRPSASQSSPTGQNVVPENLDPKLMEELKRIKKIMLS